MPGKAILLSKQQEEEKNVVNRTETAMTQDHCFLATELALKAQKKARRLNV